MAASFADQDIWHVLFDDRDMKRLNVDQLDDAFRLSLVDASTLVWKTGMATWQRLGAVAGLDADPAPRRAPPPPPPPVAAPRARPAPAYATGPLTSPFVQTYAAPLHAPDPYVLPKRRMAIPSEVDFRRRPGSFRLGRFVLGLTLLSAALLVAYRQDWLHLAAQRAGFEAHYLHGERTATAFVSAKAPPGLQHALRRLALLPGPNALPLPAPQAATAPSAATPEVAAPVPARSAASAPTADDEVQTVALDALPLLSAEPEPGLEATPPAATPARAAPVRRATPTAKRGLTAAAAKPTRPEESTAPAKAKPRPIAPPVRNESPLKAAIRSAIAEQANK